MTNQKRIKVTWASLRLCESGEVMVCVKGNGSPRCICFESLAQLGRALSEKALTVRKWAVAIPRDLSILKSVSLPAGDMDEAAKMVEYEVPSLVPLPLDEVVYGCTVVEQQDSLLDILVYIVKADALERHLEPYRAAGIVAKRVTPDVLAIHGWFIRAHAAAGGPAICVLADGPQCHLLSCRHGNFRSSRVLRFSADTPGTASEVAREIIHESRLIDTSPEEPTAILLAGRSELISRIDEQLRSLSDEHGVTGDVAVLRCPPTSVYRCPDESSPRQDGRLYGAVVAAGLLELSVNSKQSHANLVPRGYLAHQQRRALVANALRVAGMSVLLVLLSWVCLQTANRRLEKACRMVNAQIAPIEQLAGGVDRKRQRLRATQRQLSNRGRIAELITELYECTPKAISISQLDVTWKPEGMFIDIKGQADLLPTAFEYTDAVREANLLQTMQIVHAQQIPRPDGRSVVEFRAHCLVREDGAAAKP